MNQDITEFLSNLVNINQYAKLKNVSVNNVHYWIKKKYLPTYQIAGKKFIDKNANPQKILK